MSDPYAYEIHDSGSMKDLPRTTIVSAEEWKSYPKGYWKVVKPLYTHAQPEGTISVPVNTLQIVWNTLSFYGNVTSYEGERTGGVLAGCPRAPDPTPAQMAAHAQTPMRLLQEAMAASAKTVDPT